MNIFWGIICSILSTISNASDNQKQSQIVNRLKTNLASRIAVNDNGRLLHTSGTQGNYDPSDAYESWAFTSLGMLNTPSEIQPCTTAQPNLDLDLCEEYVMQNYGIALGGIIQNIESPGNKRVSGCFRHQSNTHFYYNLHTDGNSGYWNQQRVVCRDHQLITPGPTSTPSAAPTTTAPTPPPTFPTGWPIYYTWGNDASACPCSHQSVPQYVAGNLINSGEGCHDILSKDACLAAFSELFPGLPTPVFHGHIDDPSVPRGCAWTENVVFGSHGAPSFLINYHETGSSGSYDHTVICKNHDYEFPDDVYLPLFDPTSEWIEYTSNNCGPGHVDGTRASTGVCTDIVVDGVSYINNKVAMLEIAETEGSGGGRRLTSGQYSRVMTPSALSLSECYDYYNDIAGDYFSVIESGSFPLGCQLWTDTSQPNNYVYYNSYIHTTHACSPLSCVVGAPRCLFCIDNTPGAPTHAPTPYCDNVEIQPSSVWLSSSVGGTISGRSNYVINNMIDGVSTAWEYSASYNHVATYEFSLGSTWLFIGGISGNFYANYNWYARAVGVQYKGQDNQWHDLGTGSVGYIQAGMTDYFLGLNGGGVLTKRLRLAFDRGTGSGGVFVGEVAALLGCVPATGSPSLAPTSLSPSLVPTTGSPTTGSPTSLPTHSPTLSRMEKVTMDGCEYYGWKIYHCVASGDTHSPTTASPTTTAPTSPTAAPSNEPTVSIPIVHIVAIGASCPVASRPTEAQCIAIQGSSQNDASCAIGGLGADCEPNYELWYGNWPWVDVTPPLNGVPSGCIVHDDGGSQYYFYNTGTTGETTGNGYYEVCIEITEAPTSAPSAPTSAPTNAPTYDPALYWQVNEFYPKTDGTCAEACDTHVPNSVTGIESDDPNLCGEDEFPY